MRSLLLTLCTTLAMALPAQGIEFFDGSWEEALEAARSQEKLIFVDAYASWCGPCKRMSAQVFPLPDVGRMYNESFINVKLDMEKPEAMGFRQEHSVSAYPTLLFVNAENEAVHKAVGGKSGPQLIQLAREALALMDDLEAYTSEYEEGRRDPDFIFRYIRALQRNGESHMRVANDYLRNQDEPLNTEENLKILMLSATHTDSRIFGLLLDQQTAAIAAFGREAFEEQVRTAAENGRRRAIEFHNQDMLDEAVDHMKNVLPQQAEAFELTGNLLMAEAGTDAREFFKAARQHYRKVGQTDPQALGRLYEIMTESDFVADTKVMDLIETVGWQVAENEEGYSAYYRLAQFMNAHGRKDVAMRAIEQCLEHIPEGETGPRRAAEHLMQRIEGTR